MKQTYIEYLRPGAFVSDSSTFPVADRTPLASIPEHAYGYRFYDQEEVITNGELLTGQIKNVGPITYFGRTLTLGQVKDLPGTSILRSNMERNGYDRVVNTVFGNFYFLEEGDVVLTPTEA